MPEQTEILTIDVVSDVVCPWCIIGYQQLHQALRDTAIQADIHWHPFQLNPTIGEDGENLGEHLAAKYGTSVQDSLKSRERLTQLGAEVGFIFNYTDEMRTYNTFRCHILLRWAQELGRQHDLKMALFRAFFTDRRNIGDGEVLAQIAAEIGLDAVAAKAVVTEQRFADEVRKDMQIWVARGVSGVPAMVFRRKYLVAGAQGVENYMEILRQLADPHITH